MDQNTIKQSLNEVYDRKRDGSGSGYLARLDQYEKETKSAVPSLFKQIVDNSGFNRMDKHLSQTFYGSKSRDSKLKKDIKMDGLDACQKFSGRWTANDFGDTELYFIFSHEVGSGDAFYLDKKGSVMFCTHDPVKHYFLSPNFKTFLKEIK
jgi:hypothetical protein